MGYRNKFGMTEIRKKLYKNLAINYDSTGSDISIKSKRVPVLLYTPSMGDADNHHHIELSRREAKALHKWLSLYLNDTKKKSKRNK